MKEEFENPKMEINLFQKGNVLREKGDIFARQDIFNDEVIKVISGFIDEGEQGWE